MQRNPISNLLDSLIQNPSSWNYYNNAINSIASLSFTDIQDADNCRNIITNIIGRGEKDEIYMFSALHHLDNSRIRHILSTYFIGILLFNHSYTINRNISSQLDKLKCLESFDDNNDKFLYLWMLIVFFHDLGYAFENHSIPVCEWEQFAAALPKRPTGIPRIFSEKRIERYAKYRHCRFGVYDHGIYGGKVLYNNLCKLREIKSKYDTKNYWGSDLIPLFALAAWVVTCHNIWFISGRDKNRECYDSYGLERFIINDGKRLISAKRHALLFLLCLVDTIDPVKSANTDLSILEKISIGFDDKKIILDFSDADTFDVEKYRNIGIWLTDIEITGNIVSISLEN